MQEEIENKTLSLIINTSKFTERTLATAFAKALKLGWNKAKALSSETAGQAEREAAHRAESGR